MTCIHEVVNQALTTGFLSLEAEERLRQLLQTTQYGVDEMNAFVNLQLAAMAGKIRQESRERLQQQRESECTLSCSAR
ncbi:hypothetical protein [Lyngbya sp. PCC 8106]|uniref:hypothetical protein n=1 Tax=Lyngbya sp. (strain PCC 8106) TaxID=313612 RepID=UPI0000EAC6F7|nr:hypothetical protein [Lyngbya sp. PCC 8106]EAW38689.1 hypothetical protein L8106_14780 [Lyngbya sp. PCC 8106]